jgi:hypothetical protein
MISQFQESGFSDDIPHVFTIPKTPKHEVLNHNHHLN